MRPTYNEIIVCTALGTRSGIQYWGPAVCNILGDRRRRPCGAPLERSAGRPTAAVSPSSQEDLIVPDANLHLRRRRDRDRARHRTAERIARGLCPRCGKQPPVPGRSLCQNCGEKRRLADRARAADRRRAGIKRVRDPEARKAECQRARQRAEDRLARGLCARCGRHAHEPARRLCDACGERQRRRDRDHYAKARAANRPYGGRNPATKRAQARRRTRNRQRVSSASRYVDWRRLLSCSFPVMRVVKYRTPASRWPGRNKFSDSAPMSSQ